MKKRDYDKAGCTCGHGCCSTNDKKTAKRLAKRKTDREWKREVNEHRTV